MTGKKRSRVVVGIVAGKWRSRGRRGGVGVVVLSKDSDRKGLH